MTEESERREAPGSAGDEAERMLEVRRGGMGGGGGRAPVSLWAGGGVLLAPGGIRLPMPGPERRAAAAAATRPNTGLSSSG